MKPKFHPPTRTGWGPSQPEGGHEYDVYVSTREGCDKGEDVVIDADDRQPSDRRPTANRVTSESESVRTRPLAPKVSLGRERDAVSLRRTQETTRNLLSQKTERT